ncbi:MAG: sulfotransferase [Woeseiaceae bacterium]
MKSNTGPSEQYQSAVRNIMELLSKRRVEEAANACQALLRSNPESNDALLLLGKARQQQGRFEEMLQLVETALRRDPKVVSLQMQFVGACQFCGQHDRALAQLVKVEQSVRNDAALLQSVAGLYVNSGKHKDAHRCYQYAINLDSNNPRYLYNLASSFVAVGDLQQAEDTYSTVIDLDPNNYDASYNRSTLRKQTRDDNHIAELEAALHKLPPNDAGEASLCYALAKEHEDLGEDESSFSYLKRGADSRRRQFRYDVQTEVSVMKRIAELFDRNYADIVTTTTEHRAPIFVLGLPRSGTTLVDRIISSHSNVESMGEVPDFAMALARLGRSTDMHRQLETSIQIDPDKLGRSYVQSLASYGYGAQRLIDKTPTNFLYIGLIAKALRGAPIVHVRRHPVDSCLAMYRALFRMGYPFSYDLDELAEYYIAYDALMKHWRTLFPEIVLDVSYEELVENQERVSKEIIAHCGLAWEPGCLEFDRNEAPVATASSAQVRKPIYRDALNRWRRFETQLAPLIERLQGAGIVP